MVISFISSKQQDDQLIESVQYTVMEKVDNDKENKGQSNLAKCDITRMGVFGRRGSAMVSFKRAMVVAYRQRMLRQPRPSPRLKLTSSSSLPFNSCRSTGRRRYSATPPDLVPCSLLRSSSVSCFPAPSQLSSSMCTSVFLCLDNLEVSISELFSLYCCQLSSLCAQSKSTSYE